MKPLEEKWNLHGIHHACRGEGGLGVAKVDQIMALVDKLEPQLASATDKQTALLAALLKGRVAMR